MSNENPYSPPRADVSGPASQDASGDPNGQSGGMSGPGGTPVFEEPELADRMVRLLGAIIDGFLLMIVMIPAMWFGGYFEAAMSGAIDIALILFWGAISVAVFLLQQAYPLYARGQTWAKWLLDIRIVDRQGAQPEFWRLIVLRYLVPEILSVIPVAGGGFWLANRLFIFGEQRRCLHDYIAGTRVINVQRR